MANQTKTGATGPEKVPLIVCCDLEQSGKETSCLLGRRQVVNFNVDVVANRNGNPGGQV